MKVAIATCLLLLTVSTVYADPLTCTLTGYKATARAIGERR